MSEDGRVLALFLGCCATLLLALILCFAWGDADKRRIKLRMLEAGATPGAVACLAPESLSSGAHLICAEVFTK